MSATLPADARIFWAGTNASIPSGFSEDTDFANRYLQEAATAGTNGGSTTHSHTADTHTHTQNSHTHNMKVSGSASLSRVVQSGGINSAAVNGHTHTDRHSVAATATNQNTVITINSAGAEPEYTTVIVLAPDDGLQDIPDDGIAFSATTRYKDFGFDVCDGNNGTTDLDGYFLKGVASGGDGGSTGGSATHTHTSPAHTHTQNAHSHSESKFGQTSTNSGINTSLMSLTFVSGVSVFALDTSHHQAVSISSVAAVNQSTAVTVNSASSEPAYEYLLAVQNTSGASATPEEIIVPFVGDSGDVPSTWEIYDLNDRQIKCTADINLVGTQGGSNTHTHTTAGHTHTQNSHIHSFTQNMFSSVQAAAARSGVTASQTGHTHTDYSMVSAVATNNQTVATMSSDDIRYSYRTVILIRKKRVVSVLLQGGLVLGGLIR